MTDHRYYVYIMASTYKRLYTGMTSDLDRRVEEHKSCTNPNAFTARYRIDKLVYFQRFQYVQTAITRETEIKGWLRLKKLQLIVQSNPTWRDLSKDWEQPIGLKLGPSPPQDS